ncbi:uncharacterized protein LOC136096498 [Hydra vulgaris]|uniref:uncharacterized protein LOC136096498 n=1 Tax=Hydra vulgaris TaxID=6087 RepID=UPI0032EA7104
MLASISVASSTFKHELYHEPSTSTNVSSSSSFTSKRGRPKIPEDEGSLSTKKRRSLELATSHSTEVLLSAASARLKNEDKVAESKIVQSVAKGISNLKVTMYTADEALALLLDCNFTKNSYQHLRLQAMQHGCCLCPPYNNIRESKEKCFPSLIDHTATRIYQLQQPVLATIPAITGLTLCYKIGFDAATGQSIFKQPLSKNNPNTRNLQAEQSLFITCIVPLEMYGYVQKKKSFGEIQGPHLPCTACLRDEEVFINQSNLQPTIIEDIQMKHILEITMIDGKVATALSDVTSSSQCSLVS